MINYLFTILILLINFIFQTTILQNFSIMGIVPNTSLIIVVIFALLRGKYDGAFTGLIAGLLQDIFFSQAIGVNALIYFLIGYVVGLLDDKVFKENLVLPFMIILSSTFAYNIMYYLFMIFLSRNVSFTTMMKDIIVIEMIYNSIIGIFIYRRVIRVHKEPKINFTKRIR